MNITKAVIPAAGFGTRMLPAAKAVPKELLPILDRPTIQFVVEEAAAGGIDDVLLITSRDKRAVEDHFDRNKELEDRLKAGGKEALLASLAKLASVKVHSVRQPDQRGLGDAVYQAKRHVGNEPFLCLLGDTIFSGDVGPASQLVEAYKEFGTSVIGVEEVPPEKVDRYGIVGGEMVRDGVLRLNALVEKPSKENAPSRYAIAARYVLSPRIFDALERTPAGKGGEIQLTDAMKLLLADEPIHAVVLKGKRHDIGNPVDWLKTNLLYAWRDAKLREQIEPMLRELLR
ncbi:MAG TPA: UTP--glucose-1-phosphate uridylyltransferase GalU [Tepidisphaeraceae bacterium]|jgi:UTP--glucose-1-phosphate uridylyltransferase|nr:UTP--glucose-1-phosphate uridylyltransferase GalU [Tepidisphaeraceae bacterium]